MAKSVSAILKESALKEKVRPVLDAYDNVSMAKDLVLGYTKVDNGVLATINTRVVPAIDAACESIGFLRDVVLGEKASDDQMMDESLKRANGKAIMSTNGLITLQTNSEPNRFILSKDSKDGYKTYMSMVGLTRKDMLDIVKCINEFLEVSKED